MEQLVKITFLLTALSTSVFSAPNEIIYEKAISSGENISFIEPIVDINNELSAIVYTDSVLNKIIIDYTYIDSVVQIDVPSNLMRTITRYSDLRDTLVLYTLSSNSGDRPQITITKIFEQTYTKESIAVATYTGFSGRPFSTNLIEHFDFRFYPNAKEAEQLIFEFNYRVNDYIVTMGPESYNVPTTIIYSLDLKETIHRVPQTSVQPAYLFSDETINFIYGQKYYYSYDFRDIDNSTSFGTSSYQKLEVFDKTNNLHSQLFSSYDNIYSLHVDNFAPSSATEELIIHANSADLLEYYDKADHIACYSFAGGTTNELWYNNDVAGIDFSYAYQSKDMLVGIGELNEVIMFNYLNGKISDTSYVDVDLVNINFFETGEEQAILNLVGISYDIVKVYRFDIATDIADLQIERDIPQTFSLLQNHPNPFNGETRLEFSNSEDQFLKLSIFNILGQEIKILAASKFASGTYTFYWDGYNDNELVQSTGIYFARLGSPTASQMIKLIYLK